MAQLTPPKYDLTITIYGVKPDVCDDDDLQELLANPHAWFNMDPAITDWLRSADYNFDLEQAEQA